MQQQALSNKTYEFDFAFSFAGEDRELVSCIKDQLEAKGYRVLYDYTYQAQLVGRDLYQILRDVYRNLGKFVVCYISDAYVQKKWTNLEFTAVKERFLDTFFAEGFLIPILIDNASILKDVPSFIGFYNHIDIDKTVEMLCNKHNSYIEEDNMIDDIQRFIKHIKEHVAQQLERHKYKIQNSNNSLLIKGDTDVFTFRLATDSFAQTPCVLFFEGDSDIFELAFPALVITWFKFPSLRFAIHVFSEYSDNKFNELSFNELIMEICVYIKRRIGDRV